MNFVLSCFCSKISSHLNLRTNVVASYHCHLVAPSQTIEVEKISPSLFLSISDCDCFIFLENYVSSEGTVACTHCFDVIMSCDIGRKFPALISIRKCLGTEFFKLVYFVADQEKDCVGCSIGSEDTRCFSTERHERSF